MHVELGGYHVRDIEFSAAFDVNATKVGRDLGEAIYAEPNNTIRFADVPSLDVPGAARTNPGRHRASICKAMVTRSTLRPATMSPPS